MDDFKLAVARPPTGRYFNFPSGKRSVYGKMNFEMSANILATDKDLQFNLKDPPFDVTNDMR